MAYESAIISFIVRLWFLLGKWYKNSFTAAVLGRFGNWLKRIFSGSAVLHFLGREGYLSGAWYECFFYRILKRLLELLSTGLLRLDCRFREAFNASLGYRIIKAAAARTHIFLAIFLAVMMVIPHSRWDNLYSTVAVIGLLLLFLIKVMTDREVKFYLKAIDLFLFIFIVCVVLAEVFSIYPGLSLRFLIFYLTCFMVAFLLVSSVKNTKELGEVIGIILLGLAVTGLYGVYQGIKGVPVKPSEVDLSLNEGMPGRIYSTMGNSNNYAEVVMMLLPFAAAAFLNARYAISRLFFLGLAVPPFIALLMTMSRSSWIGFAIAVLVFVFIKNKKLIPLLLIAGVLCIPILPQSIYRRILTITNMQDTSTSYRFNIYKTVWPMFKDYWKTGIGLGTDVFKQVVQNYSLGLTKNMTPVHSHNVTLQVWFETGAIGVIAFIGFILGTLKKGVKAYMATADPHIKNIAAAGVSSLTGIMTVTMAEYVWFYPRTMLVFWTLIGIILTAVKLSAAHTGPEQAVAADGPAA